MPAYVIGIPVTMSPEPMTAYREGIEGTLAAYGGRYRVPLRGRSETLEGEWPSPDGVAVIEFPTYEQASAWYRSAEYAPLLAMRLAGDRWNLMLVDGLGDDGDPYAALTAASE